MISKTKQDKVHSPSKVKKGRKVTLQVICLSLLLITLLSSIICRWPFEDNLKYRTIIDVVFSMFVPIVFISYVKKSRKQRMSIVFHISLILVILALIGNHYFQRYRLVTLNVIGNSYKGLEDDIREFNKIQKKEGNKIKATLIRDWSRYFDTNKRWEEARNYLLDKDYSVDVIELDGIWIKDVMSLGEESGLVCLDELYSTDFLNKSVFISQALEVGKENDHQYAVPLYIDVGLILYRKDIFDKILGANEFQDIYNASDKSLEFKNGLSDFFKLIEKVLVPGRYNEGFVFQGGSYEGLVCSFIELLSINKGQIKYNENNKKVLLNTYEIKKTISDIRDGIYKSKIIPPSIFGYDEGKSRDSFYEKYSIVLRNWPFTLQMCEGEFCKDIGIMEIKDIKPVLGGWYLAIPKRSKHQKEAWELIKYLTDPYVQFKRATQKDKSKRRLPTVHSSFDSIRNEKPSWNNWLDYVKRIIEKAEPRPIIPQYMIFSEIFSKTLFRLLSNPTISDDGISKELEECEKNINKKISNGYN